MSVLSVESGLNPQAENNSGTDAGGAINSKGAYGLAQWNGPRQQALQDFAAHYVMDESATNTQLAFVLTEAANSYPEFWKAIISPASMYSDVITAMVDTYERPANMQAEIAKASAIAADIYANYQATAPAPAPAPTAPTPAPAPAPTPTPASTVSVNQQQLELAKQLLAASSAILATFP